MLHREGSHDYNGVPHQQTEPAFPVLDKIIKENNVKMIIEIGTGMGGCTLFFSERVPVLTYDIVDRTAGAIDGVKNIDRRLEDCFAEKTVDHIIESIKSPGCIFVMCDGEAKAKEVSLYAKHLKVGDIIFCHDWEDQFGWEDVKDAVGGKDFEPVEKELCDKYRTNLQGWIKI